VKIRFSVFGREIASIDVDGGPERWNIGGGGGLNVGEGTEDNDYQPSTHDKGGYLPNPVNQAHAI
jgi:hypothetical protein